ncbi:MAG: glycosyltransferase family 1 protein [Patescibacteria group bacterium]|jgi:glycosyltransferase involved in cell wall biosynthesis
MTIGVDIRHLTSPHYSGVQHYTVELLRCLFREDPSIHWVLFASGTQKTLKNLPVFLEKNVELAIVRLPNKLQNLALMCGKTLESFSKNPIDIWFFPNQNIVRTRLPFVLTVHDVSFKIFPEFFTWKSRLWHRATRFEKLLKDARTLLAVSESTKRDVAGMYNIPEAKICVTHLGVSTDFSAHALPSDKSYLRAHKIWSPYFLTLATQEPRKNLESMIEAFEQFKTETHAKIRLVLAGPRGWKNEHVRARIGRSPFASDIQSIGYVKEEHRPALYRGATAFLFPSFYEGFGLPVLEALACGTPVMTSPVSSIPEIAKNAAIYVDPFSLHDITEAMKILTQNNEIRASFKEKGPRIAQKFTWQKTAKMTLEALKNAAQK